MGEGRRSGSASGVGQADVERLGAAMTDLAAQQGLILERVERLVQLNEQMWDHHLQFCGRLIETVTQTDVQLREAQVNLERELDALRHDIGQGGPGR